MPNKRMRIGAYAALCFALGGMMLLLSYITLYSDDYQYAAFFRDGLASFWEKTVAHYTDNNGRAMVHFLAEVFLLGGTKVYAVFFPFLLALAFAIGAMLSEKERKPFSPAATAVSLALLLALPAEYLKETLCWVSGSFNYCFPFLLVTAYFAFSSREGARNVAFSMIIGFLAGATTEQSGLAALVGGCLLALLGTVRKNEKKRTAVALWLPVLSVLLGYLTVLLAPGTGARMESSGLSGLSVLFYPGILLSRFKTVMLYFAGGDGFLVYAKWLIPSLLGLLGFLPLFFPRKRLRPLFVAFPVAIFYFVFLFSGWTLGAHLTLFLGLLVSGICLLTDADFSADGVLLLSGLASLAVMVFTELGAYRTVMPLLLFLITVTVRLLFAILAERRTCLRALSVGGVLLCCIALMIPTFRGYRANAALIKENEEAIKRGKETGEIILQTDFDDRYRHLLMFDGAYFFTQFRILYEIPPETNVYLEGIHYAHYPIFCGEEEMPFHAVMTSGVLYLPMVDLFRFMGGDCVWDFEGQNGYYLSCVGEPYYLSRTDGTIRHRETGEITVADCSVTSILAKDYIDALSACRFFELTWELDGERVTLVSEK